MSRLNSFFVISALMLIGLTATQLTKPAHAFDGGIVPKSGYVTTRGLVLDEATGKPVYGPAVDDMADAYVISADQDVKDAVSVQRCFQQYHSGCFDQRLEPRPDSPF